MLRLTYAKLFDIEQGEKEQGDIEQEERESPGKFLDRLWEALCQFTDIDPESAEEK